MISQRIGDGKSRRSDDGKRRQRIASRLPALLVFAFYLLLGILIFWGVWGSAHPSAMAASSRGDPSWEMWYLAWLPYALGHGLNPFLSNWLLYPTGVNLPDNTSMILPAFALSPVTVLFGPVASYAVAGTLAPAVSGWSAYFMIRRFVSWQPAAVVGGLFYGFSPYVVNHLPIGDLQFTWLIFPPLLVIVLHELLVRQERSALRYGIYLGALLVGQYYTGTEFLALSLICVLVTVLYLTAMNARNVWLRARHGALGIVVGAGIFLLFTGYPLYLGFVGPAHFSAIPWSSNPNGLNPKGLITPFNGPGHMGSPLLEVVGYSGPIAPAADFLGIALVAVLVLGLIWWWRDEVLRWCAVLFAFCTILSLGIDGISASWTPWHLFDHLPVLKQIYVSNFAGMSTLFVALAFGLVLDHLRTSLIPWQGHSTEIRYRTARKAVVGCLVAGLGLGVLVPIFQTMSFPLVMKKVSMPAWFSREAKALPPKTTLLVFPFPSSAFTQSMTWQAIDAMSFRQVGGYTLVPGENGQVDHTPPGTVGRLLVHLSEGPIDGPLPPANRANLTLLQSFIRSYVDEVVATNVGTSPSYAVAFMTATLGQVPQRQDGSWVWKDVRRDQPILSAEIATAVSRCAERDPNPATAATCVMQTA